MGAEGPAIHRRLIAALVVVAAVAGCTGGPADAPDGAGTAGADPPAAVFGPPPGGTADAAPPRGLGPVDPRPARTPVQAGPALAGRPLPTNQWWTSALTGPWTQPLWAFPVVARAEPRGLGLNAPATVTATADAITTTTAPAWWVGGPLTGVSVVGYGEFSVTLELRRAGADPIVAVVAQGSPIVTLWVPAGPLSLDGTTVTGPPPVDGAVTSALELRAGDRTWDVRTSAPAGWRASGGELVADLTAPTVLAVAPRPDGATPEWAQAFTAAAPVVSTASSTTVVAGAVEQRLVWRRDGAAGGPVALLPHQVAALPSPPRVLGRYATARGPLTVVDAAEVTTRYPLPGLLVGPPPTGTPFATPDLAADLAATRPEGGSYAHPKALGRLTSLAEAAAASGSPELGPALDRLQAGVRDWLTYDGPADPRWLAHDDTWGGIVAHPAEFGNNDYNDHHFHYGYLIRAAAVLERLGRPGDDGWRSRVDLLVGDVLGASSTALPEFRVWNAYQGHSAASGFPDFGDGTNQESSSEAVAAWEAIAAWGWATGRDDVADAGLARYAIEAATARTYWLGQGLARAPGYAHTTAGIVWGGKVDFATFFDGRPEAVIGIQLLPFTFGSLYRAGPAAGSRAGEAAAAGGGTPRLWPDLFAMERAMADPDADAAGDVSAIEAGNSRTWMRLWRDTLRSLGRVRTDVVSDPPVGTAFERDGRTTLVAVNPSPSPRTVEFRRGDGTVVGRIALSPFGRGTAPGLS